MEVIHQDKEFGKVFIKNDNQLIIGHCYYLYNGIGLEEVIDEFIEDEEDDNMVIDISNGFKLEKFHDLYQYNCCNENEDNLKLLSNYFDRKDLLEKLNNPLKTKSIIKDFKYELENEYFVNFKFNFNDMEIQGSFCSAKYIFLNDLEYDKFNLEDLVNLHISLNKEIAKCSMKEFGDYCPCLEDWVKENV